MVTASVSAEPKSQFKETVGVREYGCDICGYKQKVAKQTQNGDVKVKVSARVKKTKKAIVKTKTRKKVKAKTKTRKKVKAKLKKKKG